MSTNATRITSMRKGFILTVGVLLTSYLPTVAQTPPTVARLEQATLAPKTLLLVATPANLPRHSFVLPRPLYERTAPLTLLLSSLRRRGRNAERLFPLEGERTSFVSKTHVTVVQLWSGHIQLDGFASTHRMQNVLYGLSDSVRIPGFGAQAPREQSTYGISLSFHLRRRESKQPKISTARFAAVKSQLK